MTAAAAPSISSYDERSVLARYAGGTNLADIGREHQQGLDWVAGLIMRVANMDRGRARAAVLAYDSRMSTQGGRRDRERAPVTVPAAAPRPVPARPVVAVVVETPPPAPEPEPGTPDVDLASPITDEDIPDLPPIAAPVIDVEALLKDAETCGLAKLSAKAAVIRGQIGELAAAMAGSQEERTLREFIRVLTEQRDKAVQELKDLTAKTGTRTPRRADS